MRKSAIFQFIISFKAPLYTGLFNNVSNWDNATFPVENHSDILRILLLYLYGGAYFDLDVISLKEFNEKLPINFVIAKDSADLNNAILRFSKGHPFLQLLMSEIVSIAWIKRIECDKTCRVVKS